jgi:hypothetical protein
MTVLVRQNTAGTSQLGGSFPDPVNVPGDNWYATVPTHFLRSASGGVLIPDDLYWYGLLNYNIATPRHKISLSNVVLLTTGDYVNLIINSSGQNDNLYVSGTGYFFQLKAGESVRIYEWSGSGAPTLIGTSSSALPASPITVTSAFIEHLTSGTLNASVTVGGTTYTSTATVGSPLSGTYAGLFSNSGPSGGITASEILIEDNGASNSVTRVVQSTAGTSALNGTAPNPTNVPGNNWVSGSSNVTRRSSGGVWMPSTAFDTQLLSYNLTTARQKIYATNITTLDTSIYVRALINKDASGSAPFVSGTGYALIVRPGLALDISSWSGSAAPTNLAVSASSIPNSAFTISQLTFEHLTNGTLNASVTIGATTYTATASVGSPLTGTWLGFANTTGPGGGMSAETLRLDAASYEARITWAEAQYQASGVPSVTDYSSPMSRGIFRGIERGVA